MRAMREEEFCGLPNVKWQQTKKRTGVGLVLVLLQSNAFWRVPCQDADNVGELGDDEVMSSVQMTQ